MKAAHRAFTEGPWPELTASQRGMLVHRLGDLVARDANKLAEFEVMDNGKLIAEMQGQLNYVPQWYYYYGGLADKVQIRYKDGYIHAKTVLIDDELLVVGSQNLHAGAFGDGGLTEYSIAVDNPQAIEEYKAYFEHYWDTAH